MKATSTAIVGCALLLVANASPDIGEQCATLEANVISCRCTGNEEFSMPEGFNYENVTSVRIASCAVANLHFSSFAEATRITELVVQNISDRLVFEPFLPSRRMRRLELSMIRRIPFIKRDTFLNLRYIETLRIVDTRIGDFQERFTDLSVTDFSMINVTVENLGQLSVAANGGTLRIRNTDLRNVTGPLNFARFSDVEIVRSNFRMRTPGYVSIEADLVHVEDSVFSNVSANVVATQGIRMNGTCADGKSSTRLLSGGDVESVNNRSPTEIIYTKRKRESERFRTANNTVCIAGNCKCPRNSGRGVHARVLPVASVSPLLVLLVALRTTLLRTSVHA